ncbi:MAG: response regulator transcription factor [Lentisphaerota bacterium]
MTTEKTIRIMIVDDHQMIIDRIRQLLEVEPDMEIVGEATDGSAALLLAEQTNPDLVLMDYKMPGMDGLEATRLLVSRIPGIRILMVSLHQDHRYVAASLSVGAKGYVLKADLDSDLVEAIRDVHNKNRFYVSPGIAQQNGFKLPSITSPPPF